VLSYDGHAKIEPVKTRLIGDFVDAYLRLSTKEHRQFMQQMRVLEPEVKEKVMQYTNTWFAEGIEKGIEKGKALGVRDGTISVILQLLRHRFGKIPVSVNRDIEALPNPQLEKLTQAILDFATLADAKAWLSKRGRK
jgi:hypothetical protein